LDGDDEAKWHRLVRGYYRDLTLGKSRELVGAEEDLAELMIGQLSRGSSVMPKRPEEPELTPEELQIALDDDLDPIEAPFPNSEPVELGEVFGGDLETNPSLFAKLPGFSAELRRAVVETLVLTASIVPDEYFYDEPDPELRLWLL